MERDASLRVEVEKMKANQKENDDGMEGVRRGDEGCSRSSGISFKCSKLSG